MDVTKCPADFRMPFQAYALAWQDAVPSIANDNLTMAFLEGVAARTFDALRFIRLTLNHTNVPLIGVIKSKAHLAKLKFKTEPSAVISTL